MWTILNMSDKSAHDLRVADLQGSRLAIGKWSAFIPRTNTNLSYHPGAANKGIVVPNIEYSWQWDALNTGSDVLAICQKDVRFLSLAFITLYLFMLSITYRLCSIWSIREQETAQSRHSTVVSIRNGKASPGSVTGSLQTHVP